LDELLGMMKAKNVDLSDLRGQDMRVEKQFIDKFYAQLETRVNELQYDSAKKLLQILNKN